MLFVMFCNVIYCDMIHSLKSKWHKTTTFYFTLFLWVRNFGNGLAGWFWLRVCLEVSVKIFAGAE